MLPKRHLIVLLTLLVSSCVPLKKIQYIQDEQGNTSAGKLPDFVLTINPGDILSIQLFTINAEAFPGIASTIDKQVIDNRSSYEKGFVVDNEGMVELPMVGKVRLSGLSLTAARDTLSGRFGYYIDEPVVVVKKLSFKITLLGEVSRPGLYYIPNEKISFFEALGLAGDLTYYGNRKTIKVIRKAGDSYREIHVDLTTKQPLSSEVTYLHPDDVVYVAPVKRRGTATLSPTVAVVTSVVATLTLVMSLIFRETN
jgi:polysaccharide biosynthesis/export protein